VKRLFDLTLSIFLIVVLAPAIALIGIIVLVAMGRPVFFTQIRPGYKKRPFKIYKFRTMTEVKDKSGNLLNDDARLTTAGHVLRRFSLDELPQLFNVLKGDLSFVGPRPLLMEYLPLYTPEQTRRHEVKPGITGWAQINGRNAITWEEKFVLDVWYVNHQNIFLDIKILWLTLKKVLKREGIGADGHATMPKFTGSVKEEETI
jgi:sugar transferase EpsL